jgi:hypothetical protein
VLSTICGADENKMVKQVMSARRWSWKEKVPIRRQDYTMCQGKILHWHLQSHRCQECKKDNGIILNNTVMNQMMDGLATIADWKVSFMNVTANDDKSTTYMSCTFANDDGSAAELNIVFWQFIYLILYS